MAFTDPSGGSSDSFTVAVAHREDGVAVVDCVRERRPPFSPEAVVGEYAALLKQYGVHQVRGDKYAGEWPREQYMKRGVHYWPSDKTKSEIYLECLPLLNGRRVELLDDDRLVGQICGLERRTARGGRDSVDHAPHGHDDLANAVLGAAWLAAGKHGVPQIQQARLQGVVMDQRGAVAGVGAAGLAGGGAAVGGELTEEELDRLADLRLRWPAERGWPPPRSVVRACLDRVVEGR